MLKSIILRICSAIVSLALLLTVGFAAGDPYDVRDPDKCLLNFSVLSDVHVEGNNYMRYKVFAKSLQNVRRNQSGNDAILFLGDNTMNGQHLENMLFHGTVHALLRGENVLTVVGNHDIGNGEGDYRKLQNRWYDYTRAFFGRNLTAPYYCEVIGGCCFIVLGPEAQEFYEMAISEAQFAFLADALAKAAETGRPAFVFAHFPTDDAVDPDLQPTDRLTQMLAEYNREHDLFVFVGHTHMPLGNWSFHNYDGYPETYLPRLTHLGGENDNELTDITGIGLEVEVYENEVLLRGRNFYTGEWYDEADEGDAPQLCEKTYVLKNPVK